MGVRQGDILKIVIEGHELDEAKENARLACVGGKSHVRTGDRMQRLYEDQLVGQIGNIAGVKALHGRIDAYRESRSIANANPTKGDGGSDIPGSNVDFKASRMRRSKDPMRYRLAVRPRERHEGNVYVFIALDMDSPERVEANLVGWASDDSLPRNPDQDGVFSGAYTLMSHELNPFPPITWES